MIRIVNAYTSTSYGVAPSVKSAEQMMRNMLLKAAPAESHSHNDKDTIYVYDACGTIFHTHFGS